MLAPSDPAAATVQRVPRTDLPSEREIWILKFVYS